MENASWKEPMSNAEFLGRLEDLHGDLRKFAHNSPTTETHDLANLVLELVELVKVRAS